MKAQLIISAAIVANRIPQTNAFQTSHFSPIISTQQNKKHISIALSAGKGFGDKPTPTKQKSKPTQTIQSQDTSTTATAPSAYGQPATKDSSGTIQEETGSQLLKELRRQEAEKRDEELRKLRDLRNTDALLAEEGAAASAIPERVAQRMGKRMLPFVGIPLFGSFASFIGFWYLATQKDLEFQPAVVATTSFVFLAIGLLVSYCICVLITVYVCKSFMFLHVTCLCGINCNQIFNSHKHISVTTANYNASNS